MKSLLQPFPFPVGHRAQAWRYQARYRRPLHFHAEPEVNLVWQGHGRFVVGERSFDVSAGSLLVLPPGIEHGLANASQDLEFFAVGFEPALVDAFEREHEIKLTLGVGHFVLSDAALRRLSALCETLGASTDRLAGETRLIELLQVAGRPGQQRGLGSRAAALVLRGAPTLDRGALAKRLASNHGDVSRAFHRENGTTFREYRHRVRVLRFIEQFDETSNLTRAALLAGFGSYSQCFRVFTSVLGVSPRAYFASELRATQASKFEPLELDG